MTCRVLIFALLFFVGVGASLGATIYEVPENPEKAVGAFEVNIMADDVHFETASIISKIRMRLAIKGVQTCKLWVFDAMDSAPIYTVPFTNVPAAANTNMSTYDFDMHLQVPKDIYVGFSAQGDGWTNTLSDYWSLGSVINQGVVGTVGQYYYGPVAGEKLTSIFTPVANSPFGCLQILSEPVQIAGMGTATGHVQLAFASLPIYATNTVERSDSVGGTNWQARGTLPVGVSSTTWGESNNTPTSSFYRVKSR